MRVSTIDKANPSIWIVFRGLNAVHINMSRGITDTGNNFNSHTIVHSCCVSIMGMYFINIRILIHEVNSVIVLE